MSTQHTPSLRHLATGLAVALSSGCSVFGPTIPERAAVEAANPIEFPAVDGLEDEESAFVADTGDAWVKAEPQSPHIGGDGVNSFQMRGVQLATAIHMIAEAGGVNIYLDAGLDRLVDASFPAITLDDALQVLLKQNGLRLVEDPPGIYWVTANDGSEPSTAHFRVQSIDAAGIVEDLTRLVSSNARLVVNAEQNLIVLDGSARDVELVSDYLDSADRLKRQVLLELELVELTLNDTFELGISYAMTDAEIGGPNFLTLAQNLATGNGEFTATLDNTDIPLSATLTALQQYAGVNVLSSPRVLAVTKSPAKVEVVTEIPYIRATVETNVGGGSAGTSTAEEVEFKESGLTMSVTPTIQEGGVVEIVIEQKFSNVVDYFQDIPVLDSRNLSTVMSVQDGHTAVLGGLIQNAISEDDTGVPLLMDIPLVGRLFRSDIDQSQRRQLLVFVTPRVLSTTQSARLSKQMRGEYRETLRTSGLSPAEDL
ncbi:MAG: type II and III secretion system protein [Planctomycetes bacterium]|nr:type II and III secretion system protein [Planctomycetota bacterium]MCB9902995.1 type II and III secretion system protein [Planctomycetota bacterium]